MRKNITALIIVITAVFAFTGCTNLLEGELELVTEHQAAPFVRPPTEQISVSDYDELISTVLSLIIQQEAEAQILYYPHDGEDVQSEINRAMYYIINTNPIGAYSVANITADATRIVTHFEIDIEVEYKRTIEQVESIVNVSTQRYLQTQLLNFMSQYREEAVIRTSLNLTEEDITALVISTYYQNPRRILMLPFVAVEVFPEEGNDRIYEIQFGYIESSGIMQRYSENLTLYIRTHAEIARGNTDSEIILSLVNNLIEFTSFDEGTARTIQHGAQNFAATAFGALVRSTAVGEGFAMAFKALCDELGFDCRIILGYIDGIPHAWNIILLYGNFYHIDVAMSSVNGLETAFLKTDADFEGLLYTWDRENTVRCEGELTLDAILSFGDIEELDENEYEQQNNEEDD